jgi:hypothetical protein
VVNLRRSTVLTLAIGFIYTAWPVSGYAQFFGSPFGAPATSETAAPQTLNAVPPATPKASDQSHQPKRTAEAAKRKFPVEPPLPPVRPWGKNDAPNNFAATSSPETKVLSSPLDEETARGPNDVGQQAHVVPKHEDVSAAARDAPVNSMAGSGPTTTVNLPQGSEQVVVLIVKGGLEPLRGLHDVRIASGLEEKKSDDLRRLVMASSGVNLLPVQTGWTSGLVSLARGEVDGVLVGLGPRLTSNEKEVWNAGGYKVLEIPVSDAPR